MDYYEQNKKNIIAYIKNGEKKNDVLTIGVELEHIIVEKESLNSISYGQEKGVKYVLEQLFSKGWVKPENEKELLTLNKHGDNITLEPGAQLEISIKNCISLEEIEKRYISFLQDILPILQENNYYLLCIGYHPRSKVEDIPFIPKKRYKYMSDYLQYTGKHGLHMMKGTASLQVAIDYRHQEDYIKKNRVANFLSPAISFLFDNTPIFEGKIWTGHIARVNIWNHVDDERCRIIPRVLDKKFQYEDYASYVLNRPCVLALVEDTFIDTKNKLVKDIYSDKEMTSKEIEHILTMFFPDVRTKKYLEIRMMDSVPYPYNISCAALWKGLLYHEDQLDYFYKRSLCYTNQDIQELKDGLIVGNEKVIEQIQGLIQEVLQKAIVGLEENEKQFLMPLIELSNQYMNLFHKIKEEGNEMLERSIIHYALAKVSSE
ncbi:MAG: glutamate-cysteine ligase family protein [Eubacteriales bacterium]